jgi:hypothetical protein
VGFGKMTLSSRVLQWRCEFLVRDDGQSRRAFPATERECENDDCGEVSNPILAS